MNDPFDNMPLTTLFAVAVIQADVEGGTIIYANDLLAALSGWVREELVGQDLDALIPEQSRAGHHHYRAGFMHRPQARPMGPDREVVLLHKDGHEIRVWVGLAPLDEGRVTTVLQPMDIGRSFGISTGQRL